MTKVISQKKFINEAIEAHNRYRKLHNVPPLEHDPILSDIAADWAEHIATHKVLQYRDGEYKNKPLGENILRAKTGYISATEVTDFWYNEEKNYNYTGKFSSSTGHFTQMVWKNTQKIGLAFALSEDDQFYCVFNYFPAGNIKNEFNENVLRPGKEISVKLKEQPQARILSEKNPEEDKNSRMASISSNLPGFDQMQSRFIQEALQTHNSCRKRHCVEPLVHNPELSQIAHNYAKYLAQIKTLKHSTNKYRNESLGENLAFAYDSRLDFYSGEKASMQWYDEIKDHNFNMDHQSGTGHFTQLVWKTTKEVGFGVARASDGSFYGVANYYPAGNLIGTFVKNVPRPV